MRTSEATRAVVSWGANSHGQLGLGRVSEQEEVPTEVKDLPRELYRAIGCGGLKCGAGGGGHSVLAAGGGASLWSCGWNHRGQLGLGHCRDPVPDFARVPLPLSDGVKVEAVACGWDFTVVVTSCGRALACGSNAFGQLGLRRECKVASQFTVVPGLESVTTAACGLRHSLFLCGGGGGGRAFGCGSSGKGQLGPAAAAEKVRYEARPIEGLPGGGIVAVSAGQHFSIFLTSKGSLFGCGEDKYGQLPPDNGTSSALRKADASLFEKDPLAEVRCGWSHVAARTQSGRVLCWGRNNYGQLGRKTTGQEKFPPDPLPGLERVSALSCGSEHTCALQETPDGALSAWGWNEHGNCGVGGTEDVEEPRAVLKIQGGVKSPVCASSGGHSLAVVVRPMKAVTQPQ